MSLSYFHAQKKILKSTSLVIMLIINIAILSTSILAPSMVLGQEQKQQTIPVPSKPTVFKALPKSSNNTSLGIEPENKNNWITANHDIFGTRNSNQTIIGKNNVNNLQVKWIFNSPFIIQNPLLVVGDKGYAQDNSGRILAINLNTGLNLWKLEIGGNGQNQHGLTYDNGIIFAGTGKNASLLAVNATDGKVIWQTIPVGDPNKNYITQGPPTVWKDIVLVGQASSSGPETPDLKGKVTAFNRTNGEKIWEFQTTVGLWVEGENTTKNGGATTWTGGTLDPKTGVYYVPTSNPSPRFNGTSRPGPNLWSNSVIALDAQTGRLIWGKQLISHDVHDWDAGWGNSLAKIGVDGNEKRVVIVGTKRGDAYALDGQTGNILWNKTIGIQQNISSNPSPKGSGIVWPGTHNGVEAYTANDNQTAYFAVSNMGFNFFSTNSSEKGARVVPAMDAIDNGIGNGTITAIDINTGNIKWVYPTEFPTWAAPLVTNGLVFSGHVTAIGKPYATSQFGGPNSPTSAPLVPSGIIFALDKDTGKKLWEFNVGTPIGIGGPSVGNGMLFVTTGQTFTIGANSGGGIIAFGLPQSR
jgi:glucose dehydrogenase